MFLKLPFAVSLSVLFIAIQYVVFCKSFRTFYVSLYIHTYIYTHIYRDIIGFKTVVSVYIYILTGVCKNSTMLIRITTYKYEKLMLYIYIYIYRSFDKVPQHVN